VKVGVMEFGLMKQHSSLVNSTIVTKLQ